MPLIAISILVALLPLQAGELAKTAERPTLVATHTMLRSRRCSPEQTWVAKNEDWDSIVQKAILKTWHSAWATEKD